jgi:hypothetical protein
MTMAKHTLKILRSKTVFRSKNLNLSLIVEPSDSTLLLPKPESGHDLGPVPSISHQNSHFLA